jgi:predicted amidohydrolase YtcJ
LEAEVKAAQFIQIKEIDRFHLEQAALARIIHERQEARKVRSVKLLADGALGSRGAALMAPYSDQPEQRGLLFMSDSEMEGKIETALNAGYQVNIHAIGDAANHQVLDAFEAAYKKVGGRQLRNRIEHAQVVALPDILRFKELDLIASMQPTHATSDMNMAEDRIGKERIKGAYAWRTFLHQGSRIAGRSDFPVESANPDRDCALRMRDFVSVQTPEIGFHCRVHRPPCVTPFKPAAAANHIDMNELTVFS